MTYCESCRAERDWFPGVAKVEGVCEVCRTIAVCHQRKHPELKPLTIDEYCGQPEGTFSKFIEQEDAGRLADELERKERIQAAIVAKGEYRLPAGLDDTEPLTDEERARPLPWRLPVFAFAGCVVIALVVKWIFKL